MKYRNYVNSYTQDNRIFSREDILNMPVRDAFSNSEAILAQNRAIGTPDVTELANSSNVIWVESYTRDDGTKVEGHWRSKPDSGERGLSDSTKATKMSTSTPAQDKPKESTKNPINLDSITLKPNVEINMGQNKMIDFNNKRNRDARDARECMNISIIGPENIRNNSEYSILQAKETQELSRVIGYTIPSQYRTVKYSESSSLARSLNNSAELKSAIKSWIEGGKSKSDFAVKFKNDSNLMKSLHNATVFQPKIENGYFTGYVYDLYDFKYESLLKKENWSKLMLANNIATSLQDMSVLRNYNIVVPIRIKL